MQILSKIVKIISKRINCGYELCPAEKKLRSIHKLIDKHRETSIDSNLEYLLDLCSQVSIKKNGKTHRVSIVYYYPEYCIKGNKKRHIRQVTGDSLELVLNQIVSELKTIQKEIAQDVIARKTQRRNTTKAT